MRWPGCLGSGNPALVALRLRCADTTRCSVAAKRCLLVAPSLGPRTGAFLGCAIEGWNLQPGDAAGLEGRDALRILTLQGARAPRAAGLAEEEALRMPLLEGARALSTDAEIGSLEVGKQADLAVFPSTALYRPVPPLTALLTVVAGRVVHG